ncbi:MAG: hypothetical protein ACFFC6_13090 [Promethearchaeota archaeon]
MANGELILIAFILLILMILIIRYLELAPRLIIWSIAREVSSEDQTLVFPKDIGLTADLLEIPSDQNPLAAWFFQNEDDDAGILIAPNWYHREDQEFSLKTAGLLHQAGYNVLLPIWHWRVNDYELEFRKRSISPKKCQAMMRNAYEYFSTRSEINKRNIGIWSNGLGTILACQLVKNQPIKAIVLEDGPVSLWNIVAPRLQRRRFFILRFILNLLLIPILWRTRWQEKNAIKDLHACPSFMLANIQDNPHKKLWQTFFRLHKPRNLWFEHALHSQALQDTWLQEYSLQIRTFYNFWLKKVPQQDYPDFHYDFSVKRKKKGFYPVEVRISVIPPQLERIPLQIMLSDNHRWAERRIFFGPGASTKITWPLKFRPTNISLIKFLNVQSDESNTQWVKQDAEKALHITIEKMAAYPPEKLSQLMDQYFIQKAVLLKEQSLKEDAQKTLKTKIKTKYWKKYLLRDPEARLILGDDVDEASTAVDSFFLSS